jgi:hypothetical protein
MKNLVHIISFLIAMMASHAALAQQPTKKEKIEALHVAFLTEKLNLTPKEAQVFWPVYNEYIQKREDLRKARQQARKNAKQEDQLTDKEIEQILEDDLAYEQKELDLKKDFHKKLKQVLPMKKVAMYYKAEEAFKKKILEEYGKGDKGVK